MRLYNLFILLAITYLSYGQIPQTAPTPVMQPTPSPSPMPATAPMPAPQPASMNATSPQPAPAPMNATGPAPAPMNATSPQPVPAPMNATQPAPAPMNATQPAPAPMNATQPAPAPMNATGPAPAPMNATQPAPAPMNATGPQPAPMNASAPMPAPSNDTVPQPQLPPLPPVPVVPGVTSFIFDPFHTPDTGAPKGRSNAVLGIASDDRTVVILGGNSRGQPADGNWKFDMRLQTWSRFALPGNFTRVEACTHQSLDMDNMWIYGGSNEAGETRSLLSYNIKENTIHTYASAPPAAGAKDVACAVVGTNKNFVIFGGAFGVQDNCTNSIYYYQASTNTWIDWSPKNVSMSNLPAPRRGAVAVNYHDDYFVIYGGGCGNITYEDTWRFDMHTHMWSKDPQMGEIPPGRSWAVAEIDHYNMYVFGGILANGTTATDFAYAYDVTEHMWTYMRFRPTPAPRSHVAVAISLNRVILFGGSNRQREYNDIWQFVIEQNCFILDCERCVHMHGCGYCATNDAQYGCVAGTPAEGAYIPSTCLSVDGLRFDDAHCPAQVFPAWAIGLIVVLVLIIFAFLVFCAVWLKNRDRFEQVK